jgi:site-specific DNA-cytosine methylase
MFEVDMLKVMIANNMEMYLKGKSDGITFKDVTSSDYKQIKLIAEKYNKQIKVIDTILSIIKTWKNTNDIDSPTHTVDIHDFLYADLESEDIIHSAITDELEELGYNWAYRTIDSISFVPQHRCRVYVVASLHHDPRNVLLSGESDIEYGKIDYDKFISFLKSLKSDFLLSFDGISAKDNTVEIPKVYNEHKYIYSGKSSFNKIRNQKDVKVFESLYIKTKSNINSDEW